LSAVFFNSQQGLQTDGVRRDELIELENRRRISDARLEQLRHFPAGEPSGQVHDMTVVLASDFNPTMHGSRGGKKRASDLRPFA
jgi:hypothetical protein